MTDNFPLVLSRVETRLSDWVSLMTKTIMLPGRNGLQEFHSLRQFDYVSVLAITPDGRIPVVRQYRPALERFTLELPGGLLEGECSSEETAIRELVEETGLKIVGRPTCLGSLAPDTGRLENRLWCYFARTEQNVVASWLPEVGVECCWVTSAELRRWILDGQFDHALHIALVGLALMHGVFDWE